MTNLASGVNEQIGKRWPSVSDNPSTPNFLGIYYGGTGSSWLLNTLGSSPKVLVAGYEPLEWMHWKVDDATKLAWTELAWNAPERNDAAAMEAWFEAMESNPQWVDTEKRDFEGVGFKMSAPAVTDHQSLVKLADGVGAVVVVMVRRNRVKHALSLYRSHEEDKHQFRDEGIMAASSVDPRVFRKWLRLSCKAHAAAEKFTRLARRLMGEDRVHVFAYEDFVDDEGKAETVQRLGSVFRLDPESLSYSRYRKATPDSLSEAIANFDELFRTFRWSKHRHDFLN